MAKWQPIPGLVFETTHPPTDCEGRHCIVHNPMRTHMDGWKLVFRPDRGIYFERICPHGVGHPDPSQFDYWQLTHRAYEAVHGCDGCCRIDLDILDGYQDFDYYYEPAVY